MRELLAAIESGLTGPESERVVLRLTWTATLARSLGTLTERDRPTDS